MPACGAGEERASGGLVPQSGVAPRVAVDGAGPDTVETPNGVTGEWLRYRVPCERPLVGAVEEPAADGNYTTGGG